MRDYLQERAWPKRYFPELDDNPPEMAVVIPAYREPDIKNVLESLSECSLPPQKVAVIVVVNGRETDTRDERSLNRKCRDQAEAFNRDKAPGFTLRVIYEPDLPKKHAGAGLARKIGMDEAAQIMRSIQDKGIIVCLDADCKVQANYLIELAQFFGHYPECPGCSLYFEHPLDGPLETTLYTGIAHYELHLRYYVQLLRYTGYPYAYHTVGSSMAVRCNAYIRSGGMNRRKAAEDFYFLQKIMMRGNFRDLSATTVYPSPRKSARVPFGTGRAQLEWDAKKGIFRSYPYQAAIQLKEWLTLLPALSQKGIMEIQRELNTLPHGIRNYLDAMEIEKILMDASRNSRNTTTYTARVLQQFNGLKVLQFFHYYRDHHQDEIPVTEGVQWLLKEKWAIQASGNPVKLLQILRKQEKQEIYLTSNNESTAG